jgi:hypothetical protein
MCELEGVLGLPALKSLERQVDGWSLERTCRHDIPFRVDFGREDLEGRVMVMLIIIKGSFIPHKYYTMYHPVRTHLTMNSERRDYLLCVQILSTL